MFQNMKPLQTLNVYGKKEIKSSLSANGKIGGSKLSIEKIIYFKKIRKNGKTSYRNFKRL